MKAKLLFLTVIFEMFLLILNTNYPSLQILKSKVHDNEYNNSTPFLVSLSNEDKGEKVKNVDLICIVDIPENRNNTIKLIKESLKFLINLMNEADNFALISFSNNSEISYNLTAMTQKNKSMILNKIENLENFESRNICSLFENGLKLLKSNYSSDDRVASIILLSNRIYNQSNEEMFNMLKNLIENQNKSDYAFTLNTFGYGDNHDPTLMKNISLIRDGSYFYIGNLVEVKDAYYKIYGSLSTVSNVNVQLKIHSQFNITKVYGIEDMYKANLEDNNKNFNVTLMQVVYGKKYDFVLLVNIPNNISNGTEVLNATLSSPQLNERYLWNETNSSLAYEEYIRCIVVDIFEDGYKKKNVSVIEEGKEWIKNNYNGTRNWVKKFDDVINDFTDNNTLKGNASLLSKITELKTSRLGIHYDEGNSYQRNIIGNSHSIDVSKLKKKTINQTNTLNFTENNYYYFYLKEGIGEINQLLFSGPNSSFVIYSDDISENVNITPTNNTMEYYFWNESTSRIQTKIDFNHGGKFIIKKDFPFDFYTRIDGERDITFSIEFLKLDYNRTTNNSDIEHPIEINAYILNDYEIDDLSNNPDFLKDLKVFNGNFDNRLKLGKIVLKKEEISNNLKSIYNNYLYVIIKNASNSNITYNYTEGQFLFVPTDYVYSSIPENYYIYSHLERGEKTPHLYTLEIEPSLNIFKIEFDTFGNELDIKVLNHQNYEDSNLYKDYDKFNIEKSNVSNKTYINVTKGNDTGTEFNKIILSIFCNNKTNTTSSNITNLSYALKYKTDYYELNDNDNSTDNITNNKSEIVEPEKVIILGFAKPKYFKDIGKYIFLTYFIYIPENAYIPKLKTNASVIYKKGLRTLQENGKKEVLCELVDNLFNNQKKYNCTIETNGEEIDNIQIDKYFEYEGVKLSNISISPVALQYINNLQRLSENEDQFEKKIYILDNSRVLVDNNKREFNITGNINDKEFNYTKLNLEISLSEKSNVVNENILCNCINMRENIYTLQCKSYKEMNGELIGAFSNLGNENLIVNFLDTGNKTELNFDQYNINKYYRKKDKNRLSAGAIVAIIIPCLVCLLGVLLLVIYYSNKSKKTVVNPNSIPSNMGSTSNINSSNNI